MRKLKVLISIILAISIIAPLCAVFAEKSEEKAPKLSAEAWILIDGETGFVLAEKNSKEEMYPASTTKIFSYLVVADAVESGDLALEDELTFTKDMQDTLDPDGSNIELKAGEKMSVLNLLRAMLIASGNDAATLLAISAGGSEKKFVEKMNAKADELGLEHTHFTNPHGLTDSEHYTTAADLAKAARTAMEDSTFRDIVGSKTLTIDPTNKTETERYYINTNNLISTLRYSKYYYDKATGIKTGYTEAAGNCLVASAADGGRELICVVLKSEASHDDAKTLLEYGFDNFKQVEIVKKGDLLGERTVKQGKGGVDHIRGVAAKTMTATIPKSASDEDIKAEIKYQADEVYAPVKKGDVLGSVTYTYKDAVVGTMNIVAETDVERHPFGFVMSIGEAVWGSVVVRIIVYLILILLALFILLVIYGFYRSIKRSKARSRRRGKYRPPMY